jgi:mRNA interferase RelE/StbE
LVGRDLAWRIRVADYRVIFEIVDAIVTVTVVRVGHRHEVYRGRR